MTDADRKHRIDLLEKRHKKLHSLVEALEGEKAPEPYIKKAKVEKLEVRDEITYLNKLNIGLQNNQ